jgi:hypothetical protein
VVVIVAAAESASVVTGIEAEVRQRFDRTGEDSSTRGGVSVVVLGTYDFLKAVFIWLSVCLFAAIRAALNLALHFHHSSGLASGNCLKR